MFEIEITGVGGKRYCQGEYRYSLMGVRLLHAADLHLGSPLRALGDASADIAERLARASEVSVERIVTTAIEAEVDLVVVAGDLYDREARSVRANQFLVDQFARLAERDIPAYVVHGNHDPLGWGAEKLDFPENVHVFGPDEVESAVYPNANQPEIEILGQSYGSRHVGANLARNYQPQLPTVPTIGILHTGLDPGGREYVPCSPEDLANRDVQYWALGHLHHPHRLDRIPAAYPGIPQPRHAGEPPVGGCLLVELADDAPPDIEFVPTTSVLWVTGTIDVEDLDDSTERSIANLTDLEDHLVGQSRDLAVTSPSPFIETTLPIRTESWELSGVVVRWILRGRGDVSTIIAEDDEATDVLAERIRDRLEGDRPFVWIESIKDRTEPPLPDRESLIEEDAVIAEFVDLVADVRADQTYRETLREQAGGAWQYVDDPDLEDLPEDRIALTDERLDQLIDEATEIALTRLAGER